MAENLPEPKNKHEARDVNTRAVAWFATGLAVTVVVVFFAMSGLFRRFNAYVPASESARVTEPRAPVPEPRLQSNPALDLEKFRARENEILNSYGWIDQRNGIVRIPIERAMDLVAQRGLPAAQLSSGKTPLQMRQEKANAEKPLP